MLRPFRAASSLFPRSGRRVPQAPWPNKAPQPTPWIAVAFPSHRGRRGWAYSLAHKEVRLWTQQ